jgi:hypothetical protein
MVMPKMGVRNIIAGWPVDSRVIAQSIINEYGEPNEATPSLLVWYNNGPWKKTIVYRDTVKHDFPMPHTDGVEQVIDYAVPMEKACELAAFDGSISFNCTKGEISACCHDEAANFLTLNLAHDIMRDKKDFNKARRFYIESMVAYRQNKPVPYMERLQFIPDKNTADPDEVVMSEQEMATVGKK